ncbi:MAG: amino acid/amide transporter ATP-binding protein 2, family [Deltaproteobacteria bacterium]|nr:amino acid/amide transporter ATP-binding protein 2, family [Deltaproteobacteria bacterium]
MLRVKGLSVGYGDAHVLENISFQVREGEMTCILGPNGAGKTTLLRSITGLIPPTSGKIWFLNEEIQGMKTHQIVGLGMTMIPEGRRLWPPLSVRENLEMGAYRVSERTTVRKRLDWVFSLFPHLADRKDQLCGTLSGGEQQMVSIGRGLMTLPKLLLMDEPSLGLAPLIVQEMFKAIKKIVHSGTTILLVEQNTQVALSSAYYGYVLERGMIVLEGEVNFLRETPHIKHAYLGL